KHARQGSPYHHLLKPKSGGVAYVLEAMGEGLHGVVDVTIGYPGGIPTLVDLMAGRVRDVHVSVRQRPLPLEILEGGDGDERARRARFQQWINALWQEKDATLSRVLDGSGRGQ
ncbi:MAG: acyltransferase, partial [Luteimonas sp.]|nr:acyltransferase [Luteimonas sp.]